MSERWLGITVSGERLVMVDANVPDEGPLEIMVDRTIDLPTGDRAKAYGTIYQRMADYAQENGISRAFIKESAVSLGGTKKSHLLAAELRGVVICSLSSVCSVRTTSKVSVTRTFGERKTDEYLADNAFWTDEVTGHALRVGSREAVIYMLAAR